MDDLAATTSLGPRELSTLITLLPFRDISQHSVRVDGSSGAWRRHCCLHSLLLAMHLLHRAINAGLIWPAAASWLYRIVAAGGRANSNARLGAR